MTTLHSGYLTGHERNVWNLLCGGLSQSDIARRLKVSRQAINQVVGSINEKISAALMDAARLNGVEPRYLDTSKGILFGWSGHFNTEVVIALHPEHGLRVWYKHDLGQCKICPDEKQCKSMLLKNAGHLGVSLTRRERKLEPQELSNIIFSRAKGGGATPTDDGGSSRERS